MHAFMRLVLAAAFLSATLPAVAQTPGADLSQLSIEDLMNVRITSASRREQRTADVAAAVFVITNDDIRRSGMTTIPELLRLAPGVDVAQVNSNNWAVSVRGFNNSYANKLLVLVDGRSVYNRIIAGVLWDLESIMFDDVDRIEVIRGPGATVWGANAVNGVINIVTRPAAETQGGLVRVEGGGSGSQAAIRYGGNLGAARFRVYSQWHGRNESVIASGLGANDDSHNFIGGFRADWATQPDAFTLQGNFTVGHMRALWSNLDPQTAALQPLALEPSDAHSAYVLGRWTHTRHGGASLQFQSSFEVSKRQEPVADYTQRTFDVDTQYHTTLGARQDLVAGGGFRLYDDEYVAGVGFSLSPPTNQTSLLTAFIQDEISFLDNRLAVNVGSQVQYNSSAGAGVQPTVRLIWKPVHGQRLWAATSRALRTPSRYEQGIRVSLPPVATAAGLPLSAVVLGNRDIETEAFADAEFGYRLELGTVSVDATGFVGRYDHLRTTEVADPLVQFAPTPQVLVTSVFGSQLKATTRGIEVAAQWSPIRPLHIDGSYTAFHLTPSLAAASRDPIAGNEDGSAPAAQWRLQSTFVPASRVTLNLAVSHVGRLKLLQVDAYTRTDITAEWRFPHNLSLTAIGQNLLDPAHAEFATGTNLVMATQVPRSGSLRLRWSFR